jgi:hypothetical protein
MFTARIFSETDHVSILFYAVGPEESMQEHSRVVCRVKNTGVLCDGCVLFVTSRSLTLHSADCEFHGKCSDIIEHAGRDEAWFCPVIPLSSMEKLAVELFLCICFLRIVTI